jgi:hypothetical protein
MIDAKGIPTDGLQKLHSAYDTDQWPVVLADRLKKSYPAIFQIDLATASPGQFSEAFRNAFGGAEAVQRKSRTFFLNAARDAQIEISQHITKNKKPRLAGTATRRRSQRSTGSAGAASSAAPAATQPQHSGTRNGSPKAPDAYELLAVLDMSDMNDVEQNAVFTLIRYLKKKEAGVSASRQRRESPAKARPAATDEPKEAPDGTALA